MIARKWLNVLLLTAAFALASSAAHATGSYRVCTMWDHQFNEPSPSEDYMTPNVGGGVGRVPASYAWTGILVNDAYDTFNYLPESGCRSVPAVAGWYRVAVQSSLKRGNKRFTIKVNETDSSSAWQFAPWVYLPGLSSGSQTIIMSMPVGTDVTNVSALASRILDKKSEALIDTTYYLYTQTAPGGGVGAAAWYNQAWLGGYGYSKSVVTHEIGHMVAHNLWGDIDGNYDKKTSVPICTCDSVSNPGLRRHCMGSLEHGGAAATEGFGHFFAADLFNNKNDSNGYFSYYKQWHFSGSGSGKVVLSPPISTNIFTTGNNTWTWKDDYCDEGGGVELDWLTFFYELNNKTSNKFSYAEISSSYKQACGGSACDEDTVNWDDLLAGAVSASDVSTAEAGYMDQQMTRHGLK